MNNLYIAMYHYVRDLKYSRYPDIKGLDYKMFQQQIAFFKQNFHIVTMEEVIEAYNSKSKKLPENALLLTFDDGYIDHFTMVFPVLKENGIQGSFFMPGKTFSEHTLLDVNKIHFILASGNIQEIVKDLFERLDYYRKENFAGEEYELPELTDEELFQKYAVANRFDAREIIFVKRMLQNALSEKLRQKIASELFAKYVNLPEDVFSRELYMNREQIKCMKKEGMFIGLHGYDHYWLGKLPENKLDQDIEKALDIMGDFIEKDSWVMNYPYGSYNENVIEYIKKKGCVCGLTTEVRVADVGRDDKYALPRLDCNDFPPKSDNYLKL